MSNVDCSFDGDMCSWKVDSDQLRLAATTTTTSTISPPIRAEDPADKGRTETETQGTLRMQFFDRQRQIEIE